MLNLAFLMLSAMPNQKYIRRSFLRQFLLVLGIVWPVLSGCMLLIAGVGCVIALIEGWPLTAGVYFGFVTALTIGYGDLVPQLPTTRVLAVMLGFVGILMTGLFAGVGVFAMQRTVGQAAAEGN